jgi:hypothetical protein
MSAPAAAQPAAAAGDSSSSGSQQGDDSSSGGRGGGPGGAKPPQRARQQAAQLQLPQLADLTQRALGYSPRVAPSRVPHHEAGLGLFVQVRPQQQGWAGRGCPAAGRHLPRPAAARATAGGGPPAAACASLQTPTPAPSLTPSLAAGLNWAAVGALPDRLPALPPPPPPTQPTTPTPTATPHRHPPPPTALQGHAPPGALVALFPGLVYPKELHAHLPNYPKVDTDNPYLIARWAEGGAGAHLGHATPRCAPPTHPRGPALASGTPELLQGRERGAARPLACPGRIAGLSRMAPASLGSAAWPLPARYDKQVVDSRPWGRGQARAGPDATVQAELQRERARRGRKDATLSHRLRKVGGRGWAGLTGGRPAGHGQVPGR